MVRPIRGAAPFSFRARLRFPAGRLREALHGGAEICLPELTDSITLYLMEKRAPHYRLAEVLGIVSARGLGAFAATAIFNLAAMELSEVEAIAVVMSITRAMFYKSMTTHNDSRMWQDVYHVPCPNGKIAYIKLTLQAGAVVIQFKEK